MAKLEPCDPELMSHVVATAERMTGVVVPQYRWPVLNAELGRLGAPEEPDSAQLESLLSSTSMIDLVTVPESFLFRHEKQYHMLKELALSRREAGRACVVVSAGCSTGEEVWSAAAVLASVPPPPGTRHHVVGWDISPVRVARAQRGRYGKWSYRSGLRGYDSLFYQEGNEVVAADKLRSMVSFKTVNLVQDRLPSVPRPDIIFFRNVSIYWREETTAAVCAKLAELALPDTVIFVGPSDPTQFPGDWEQRLCCGTRSYWRHNAPCLDNCGKKAKHAPRRNTKPAPKSAPKSAAEQPPETTRLSPAASSTSADNTARATQDASIPTPVSSTPPGVPSTTRDVEHEATQLADRGQYEQALSLLDQNPDEQTVGEILLRGILHLNLDHDEEALRMFRQCVFLEPDVAEHHQWLALAYEALGQLQRAEHHRLNAARLETP